MHPWVGVLGDALSTAFTKKTLGRARWLKMQVETVGNFVWGEGSAARAGRGC